MDLTTQISGGYGGNSRKVFGLKRKLQGMNMIVTHPIGDGSIIIEQNQIYNGLVSWPLYEIYLDYYESVANSDFHIVYNEWHGEKGYFDETMAREVVYAMSKRRHVVLLHSPVFQPGVAVIFKRIIESRLNQLIICDLTVTDAVDTLRLARNIADKSTSYAFSNVESRAVKRLMREYFRSLLSSDSAAYGSPMHH